MPRPPSVQWDDHLVGADQPEILAHQLIGHIGIGLVGVEQVGAVLELRALLFDLRELGLALLKRVVIAAPGENPVFPGNGVAGKGPTMMTASAGIAARRIIPKILFGPPAMTSKESRRSHEGK